MLCFCETLMYITEAGRGGDAQGLEVRGPAENHQSAARTCVLVCVIVYVCVDGRQWSQICPGAL